jgi:tetratricopeptide (TPR) repeat protein
MPYDYRECGNLVGPYTATSDPVKLAAAAKVFRAYCERGDNRADVLGFVGWQMYASADPELRDPKAAEGYILSALEQVPGDPHLPMVASVVAGRLAEARRLAEACTNSEALNALAWKMSMIVKPAPEQSGLARFCAQRALQLAGTEGTSYAFILDTLAAVQSAAGDHKQALETQQKAVQLLPADSKARPDMLRRQVLYLARAAGPADGSPATVEKIRSTQARDALLARLKGIPADSELRPVLIEVLRGCFKEDPLVVKVLGKEPPGGGKWPPPEVF